MSILYKYQNGNKLNFEQRFYQPEKFIQNPDGTKSTHKMMTFSVDNKHFAAPTIVEINDNLVELTPDRAIDYAMRTGEYKEFNNPQRALAYSQTYKTFKPISR
jgi:hypothetical protein